LDDAVAELSACGFDVADCAVVQDWGDTPVDIALIVGHRAVER